MGDVIRLGLLGAGGIMRACHVPGFRRIADVRIVAVADPAPGAAAALAETAEIPEAFSDAERLLDLDGLDAVAIATPNDQHARLARAAAERGIHVLCEKPLGLNRAEVDGMAEAAERAGIVHMTAFTYRFVPSMRWMAHRIAAGEIGEPHHFRSQRFQDFGDVALGWRQELARCGSGELCDMMAHRIDYGQMLIGPIAGLFGKVKNLLPERRARGGSETQPSDVDDWAALIVSFESGCTGVFESTKVAPGYGAGLKSWDYVEVNGSEGSFKYFLHEPATLWHALPGERYNYFLDLPTTADRSGTGQRFAPEPVPEAFLKLPGSPRDPREGDPSETFRWDQAWEFTQAIREGRSARPSFHDGARVQAVLDAALLSNETGRWVEP